MITYVLDGEWYIGASLRPEWKVDTEHTLSMSVANVGLEWGTPRFKWHYTLKRGDTVIFDGKDFTSPTNGKAELTVADLRDVGQSILGFLTLRPGDTDAEYFDDYTPEQIEWRDECAEELAMYAMAADEIYGTPLGPPEEDE